MKAVAIGIDAGSTTCKGVAINSNAEIIASLVQPVEPLIEVQAQRCIAELRQRCGAGNNVPVAATGYGRKRVGADRAITEITCHARGAFHHTGKAGVLIDVGGQDTKVIHVGSRGEVVDFAMNDKCAAGTGRFLEVIVQRLGVSLEDVAKRVEGTDRIVKVSSTCTVFAESEVVSLLAQGEPLDGILRGLHTALANRIGALAGRLKPDVDLIMSGGVALNSAMVKALGTTLGRTPRVVPQPQLVGALGAALLVQM
ncbi:MAG: hypothetical protein A2341_03960 [Deltaproteobacteria bacterium RIFOXYB12_FULL_58_9]|nr:MAG: hypothetical protein A2341_03960 [Deltaproteobacteria bacterium RIFOXYB12_FULL_58_9]